MRNVNKAFLDQIDLMLLINEPYENYLDRESHQFIQKLKQCKEILQCDGKVYKPLIAV